MPKSVQILLRAPPYQVPCNQQRPAYEYGTLVRASALHVPPAQDPVGASVVLQVSLAVVRLHPMPWCELFAAVQTAHETKPEPGQIKGHARRDADAASDLSSSSDIDDDLDLSDAFSDESPTASPREEVVEPEDSKAHTNAEIEQEIQLRGLRRGRQ